MAPCAYMKENERVREKGEKEEDDDNVDDGERCITQH